MGRFGFRVQSFAFAVVTLCTTRADAFPEMVRYGYNQCQACHISNTGGWFLNNYGRAVATEVLTTWGDENSGAFAHGLFKKPEWVQPGGHFRVIQTYLDSSSVERARFFPMQAELGLGVEAQGWILAGSVGVEGGPSSMDQHLISPQHWIQSRHLDTVWVRAGRFDHGFGQAQVDHTTWIESDLGQGVGRQPYGFEVFHPGRVLELRGVQFLPAADERGRDLDSGYMLGISLVALEKHRLSLDLADLLQGPERAHMLGMSGSHTLAEPLVLTHENVVRRSQFRGGSVHLLKLNYEILRGFQAEPSVQLSYLDHTRILTRKRAWGLGLGWYPVPHFDAWLQLKREQILAIGNEEQTVAYLVAHYWL